MNTEKETIITRLSREMKVSPIPAPAPQKPGRAVLADGYERRTEEEALQTTERYRKRFVRRIITAALILILIDLLALAVYRSGLFVF